MKRTLLAGSFYALAGLATLLLAASIFYSCRTGGDPHHERSPDGGPAEEMHSLRLPDSKSTGMRLSLAYVPPSPADQQFSRPFSSA